MGRLQAVNSGKNEPTTKSTKNTKKAKPEFFFESLMFLVILVLLVV